MASLSSVPSHPLASSTTGEKACRDACAVLSAVQRARCSVAVAAMVQCCLHLRTACV